MKNNRMLLIFLVLIPICCICIFVAYLFFASSVDGKSPTCIKKLNSDLTLEFQYKTTFENGNGVQVSYTYKNQPKALLVYLDKNLYKDKVVSPFLVGADFCNNIEISKSGDVYLIGEALLIQEDAKFKYDYFALWQELSSVINDKYKSTYGDLNIADITEPFKITEQNGKFATSFFDLRQSAPKPNSYDSTYTLIGKVKFSIDYSKESTWKVDEIVTNFE